MGSAREGLGLFYETERVTVATQCGYEQGLPASTCTCDRSHPGIIR